MNLIAATLWLSVGMWIGNPSTPTKVLGPPWFEAQLAHYHTFTNKPESPDANNGALNIVAESCEAVGDGLFGRGLTIPDNASLTLQGDTLSPHRPWTLSFWWTLPEDLPVDGAYTLFYLRGTGFIAAFCRGKGEWCALERPAGVMQVYNFAGIQNVNAIYERDLMSNLDLRAGVWHHTAVVFRRGTTAQLFTDGELVCEITTKGRAFRSEDRLHTLTLGSGIVIDELAILDRAVDAEMIGDYFRGISQLRRYHVTSLTAAVDGNTETERRRCANGSQSFSR